MFMGSIDERKGVFDLIEAIKQSNCKTHLKIYGGFLNDSFTKNRFERLIRNDASIEYCGYVSGEKKEEAYSNSDVFVLPSYAEGMPIVIMEALAKGCAIVSTNVGAIPEVIGNENGYIVNPGDICAIRSAIEQIDLDRAKLKTIKRNNIEKSKNFSLEKNVKFLCSIYGGLFNDQ
jgi:glycosyltransferase involved in cell wall biosynthesis